MHNRVGPLGGIDDFLCGRIKDGMIVGFHPYPDLFFSRRAHASHPYREDPLRKLFI